MKRWLQGGGQISRFKFPGVSRDFSPNFQATFNILTKYAIPITAFKNYPDTSSSYFYRKIKDIPRLNFTTKFWRVREWMIFDSTALIFQSFWILWAVVLKIITIYISSVASSQWNTYGIINDFLLIEKLNSWTFQRLKKYFIFKIWFLITWSCIFPTF